MPSEIRPDADPWDVGRGGEGASLSVNFETLLLEKEKLAELTREFEAMQKTVWWSPGGAEKSKALCEAVAAHGNFAAPYNQSGDMPREPAV